MPYNFVADSFHTGVTAEALRAKIERKSAISLQRGHFDPKFQVPALAFPCPDRPCILDTDSSDVAYGPVLSQLVAGQERPIAFFSRVMSQTQQNYCLTRRELLAVIASLQHFRHYLLNVPVILRTDHHSLKWLRTFKKPVAHRPSTDKMSQRLVSR